ncbi:MAG: hypothetical protein R3F28_09300 [Candidatus Kapaibacterium sp.]
MRSILSLRSLLLSLAGFVCLIQSSLFAQNRIYPTVLYSGVNPITVFATDGISKVEIRTRRGWEPLSSSYETSYYRVMTMPVFGYCAKQASFSLWVERIDRNFEVEIRVTDCDGSTREYDLGLENTWTLFHEDFGTVTLDDRPCHTFMVQSQGGDFVIDEITSSSRQFTIRYPFKKPPLRIQGSKTYRYSVCFKPERLGQLKIPINVLIRRGQPVGKYTTYVVADTAYVNVIDPSRPNTPPHYDPPPVQPPPKPRPPKIPPGGPDTPPAPPIQAFPLDPIPPEPLFSDTNEPRVAGLREPLEKAPEEPLPEFVHDPTTFRTILTPTARSVGKGKGFIASYDVAGIIAGYGVTDKFTLIGGGVYIPSFINNTFAGTLGGKYEFYHNNLFRIAGGVQGNFSSTDKSDIVSVAPYITANWGTVDYSANLTAGYSWRRHMPSDTIVPPFERRAALIGIGGDYRFAKHWKVAGEAFLLENSTFQPAAITFRWFNNRVAVDAGLAVDLTPDNGLQLLPVISGIWTW